MENMKEYDENLGIQSILKETKNHIFFQVSQQKLFFITETDNIYYITRRYKIL